MFEIAIPPLRERKEDMIHITEFLIKKLNGELGSNVISFDERVREIFMEHDWRGNIRELENVLERAMNVIEGMIIQVHHLPAYLRKNKEEELYHDIFTIDQNRMRGVFTSGGSGIR